MQSVLFGHHIWSFVAYLPWPTQVDSIDASSVAEDGSGHITVLATVSESAALWASNGKQADSYHTTYQVRCCLPCCSWPYCMLVSLNGKQAGSYPQAGEQVAICAHGWAAARGASGGSRRSS